jgi:uncharacterized protein YndB with AHSA1/START domain
MDINETLAQAGFITRTVGAVDHDGRPAKTLTTSRAYPTTVEDLWDAVTNEERIPRWFLPVSGDLELGGRYAFDGNASGSILECEAPHRFLVTWEYGGETSWVTVQLTEEGDVTRLDLTHTAHVPEEMWEQYGPGATGIGWDLGLLGLALYLSGETSAPAKEMAGWEATPEGKVFVTGASDAWAEASIAAGADADAAHASAKTVAAFYTGAE